MLGLLFGVLLIVNVSAGIYFSQPEDAYNLGDTIINDITVNPVGEGFLEVGLVCDDGGVGVFNSVPIEGNAHIEFPLTTAYIQNISGDCYFLAIYGGMSQESRKFQISKSLNVRLDIDSLFAKPGEEIIISGKVERLNGELVNGGIEIDIPLLNLIESNDEDNNENNETGTNETGTNETESESIIIYDSGKFYGKVIDGGFSINLALTRDMPAGNYRIDVLAYEELSGSRTSEGVAIANLRIEQILSRVDVLLSLQNLDPGQDFNFKPRLLDQSEGIITDEVSVIITDGALNRIFEKISLSEETLEYNIPTNMSSGYYEIEVSNGGLSEKKRFYINEKEIVSLELSNNTLVVTNIGNINLNEYPIQIDLNGKPFVKKVSLFLGEKKEFKLTGDGTYDIKVSDGSQEISANSVVLTGHAVGVKGINEGGSLAMSAPMIWIFLIIILGGIGLFFLRNIFKKKSFAYPFKEKLKGKFSKNSKTLELKARNEETDKSKEFKGNKHGVKDDKNSKEDVKGFNVVSKGQAESVLVLDGQKSKATVIVLKIKNKLTKEAKQGLEKSIEHVYEKKAAVYEKGDNIFIIFTPLMTKTFKNEKAGASAAEKIMMILNEHNKKFKDKIDFGIGIHSGNIINKMVDKKLKFTALGNIITGAKRLADSSDKKILMTKDTYENAINDIKAVKKKTKDGEVYEVQKVIDKEKNKEFIQGFLGRMEREKVGKK